MSGRFSQRLSAFLIASVFTCLLGLGADAKAATPATPPTSSTGEAGISYELFRKAKRWPGKVVRYHVEYRAINGLVRDAVKVWNESGAEITWKRVPAHKAQVTFKRVVMKKLHGWAGQIYRPGRKGLYKPGQRGGSVIKIHPRVLRMSREEQDGEASTVARLQVPQIMAHEMGHIMGLAHTTTCAVMNPSLKAGCPFPSQPEVYRCRVLELDDIRGAVRLFGGTVGTQAGNPWCKSSESPNPVDGFSVSYQQSNPFLGGKPSLIVRWSVPATNIPERIGFRIDPMGTCLETPAKARWTWIPNRKPGRPITGNQLLNLPPGDYCASLFSASFLGVISSTWPTSQFTVPG